MQHLDDLYIVREPRISHAQWAAFVAQRPDFEMPDRFSGSRVFLRDVELDASGLYMWTGHSSAQHFPVFFAEDGIHFTSGDAETVFFVQGIAFELDACVMQKVNLLNYVDDVLVL
ncbi:hypothetical protein [Pseudoduganella namucuonensis]|uniref:Uncharacterized protein n=1 Tax=Pseudoduganella namucuonensis TaxID=1035707 RepID=A0A1I7JM21_9BURK|nr:hypothetical protein [Pseudoduganella namucuonensis]SFU86230.1 hypothetical protein SAMN05216552_101243 [Pseudoduganella namucuonensis]